MAKMNQDQNKEGDPRAQTDGRNKRKKKMGNRAGFMYAAALFLIFSVLGIAGYSYLKAEAGCRFLSSRRQREGRRKPLKAWKQQRGMLF